MIDTGDDPSSPASGWQRNSARATVPMPIYFFVGDDDSAAMDELEARVRGAIPQLRKIRTIEELTTGLHKATGPEGEKTYIVLALSPHNNAFERVTKIASQYREILFFIFVSDDISASDYKQLVRTGNADWVSSRAAPQEILDILARHRRGSVAAEGGGKPAMASFLPSAGGVGNTTITMEAGLQLKTGKGTRNRAICLVDMDFQTSNVCDLLDIEARLQVAEFSHNPERMDAQLFELFVSHHSSGLDVLAAPRKKTVPGELNIAALDALFEMISKRYDLVLVDLPVSWFGWTPHVLGASDLVVVTGLINIPSLRQVSETLEAVRSIDHVPPQIMVALNRSRRRLLRGVEGRQYVTRMLGPESVIYVRDNAAAQDSANTGVPMTVANPQGRIGRDLAQLLSVLSDLKARRPAA
jgi:pilus assembly protein CpaE